MMTNRSDKPVKVELMDGGSKAVVPLLPGKDTAMESPAGCSIRTVQQLGPYRATYTDCKVDPVLGVRC
jgi:hypothetical protein